MEQSFSSPRRWLPFLAAACLATALVQAQESAPATGTPGTGTSPSGGTGTGTGTRSPSSMLLDSPFGTTPQPATGAATTFRTGPASTEKPPGTPATGAASAFGTPETGAESQTRAAPTTFELPGLYGRGPLSFTAGEGRLARPRFRISGNLSVGYDDNIFQTPTRSKGTPDQKVQVLVSPGAPETMREVVIPSGDPLVPNEIGVEVIPAQKAKFRTTVIPGVPAPERIGSLINSLDLGWDVQFASRRTLFTFDLNVGSSRYWNRPKDPMEYNGNVALIYLRRLSGRAQFTAAVTASYQTQPDFSQPNAPTSNQRGSYINANMKADLSYRLTPRFSTVTSLAYNTIYSVETAAQSGDYGETTFGTELRYLFSPRITLLGEVRYSSSLHEDTELDTTTYFLLAGGELTLSRRFLATLRVGEALQTFAESGQAESAPYLEATLSYRLGRGTTVQWNGRFGYEESGAADSRVLVARSGLSLSHIFTPRLQGSLSLNLVHTTTTTTTEEIIPSKTGTTTASTGAASTAGTGAASTSTSTASTSAAGASTGAGATAGQSSGSAKTAATVEPKTRSVTTERTQDAIDAALSFHYTLSRRWALSLRYAFTMVLGPEEINDYYRQRAYLGAEFVF